MGALPDDPDAGGDGQAGPAERVGIVAPNMPVPVRSTESISRLSGSRPTGSVLLPFEGSRRRQHLLAAVVVFVPVLWLLWPALVRGQVLTADSFLYLYAPWRGYAPAGLDHFLNTILSDIPEYHYPWAAYVRASLHSGTVPIWNSYTLSGNPFFANSQTGLTSITDIPLWILPFNYAFGFVAALKLWLGAFGAYLLARELRLTFWPGIIAGVCYSQAAFNIVWLEHMTLVASSIWLPWAVLVLERLLRRPTLRWILAFAVITALIIDGGHPGTEIQMLAAAGVYAITRVMTMDGLTTSTRLRALAGVAAGAGIGALLMMFVVIPVIVSSQGTHGAAVRFGGGAREPLSGVRTLFFPDWWGRPSQRQYGGPVNYVERTLYDSVLGLLLAVLALTSRGRWRLKLPLLVMALLGPAVAYGVPVIHDAVVHLPLFASVQESRFTDSLPIGISMLAAFGMQAIVDREPRVGQRSALVFGGGVVVAAVAVLALNPSLHEMRTTLNHFRTGNNYSNPAVLALTSVGWWLIFLAGGGVVGTIAWRAPRLRSLLPSAVVLLIVLDLHHFASGLDPMGPPAKIIPPKPPAVAFLQRHAGYSRVFGVNGALVADYTMLYGLRDPGGLDPPQPTERYFNLWKVANQAQQTEFGLFLPSLTSAAVRVLNVLGTRYILVDPAVPLVHMPGLVVAYRGADATIYRSSHAAAPASVPSFVRRVSGARQALADVTSLSFDPRRDAVVEAIGASAGEGTVTVQNDVGATARLAADMHRGGLVVIDDAWAPGWTATVDGRRTRLLRVNDVMEGVDVPAGHHTIVLRYSIPGLISGLIMTGVGALLLVSGGGVLFVRRVRRRSAPPTGAHAAPPQRAIA